MILLVCIQSVWLIWIVILRPYKTIIHNMFKILLDILILLLFIFVIFTDHTYRAVLEKSEIIID